MDEIQVNYTPANISIVDREGFEKSINEIVKKYRGYVVTVDTLKEDRATRADLNKVLTQIDTKRKDIKKEFNLPLDEFQSWIKKAQKPLEETICFIDKGIKELEAQEKTKRMDVIRQAFQKEVESSEVDSRIFEPLIENLAKAINFNKDFKPKKSLQESIAFAVEKEKRALKDLQKNKQTVSEMAFQHDFSDTPYTRLLDEGRELNEVIALLNQDIQKKEAQQAKALLEREQEVVVERQNMPNLKHDQEQINSNDSIEQPAKEPVEATNPYPAQLAISITLKSEEEKNRFKTLLVSNGFGLYEVTSFTSVE